MTPQFSCITETEAGIQHPGIVGPHREGMVSVAETVLANHSELKGIFVVESQTGASPNQPSQIILYVIKGTASVALEALQREHPKLPISIGAL